MSKHAGPPVEEPPPSPQRHRLLWLALGFTIALVAWGYLVTAAIDFGAQGRDGSSTAWVFMAFATIGATACFFVFLILATKLRAAYRGELPPPRTGPPGGKRAAR